MPHGEFGDRGRRLSERRGMFKISTLRFDCTLDGVSILLPIVVYSRLEGIDLFVYVWGSMRGVKWCCMSSGGTTRLGTALRNVDAAACPSIGLRRSMEGNISDELCNNESTSNVFSLD